MCVCVCVCVCVSKSHEQNVDPRQTKQENKEMSALFAERRERVCVGGWTGLCVCVCVCVCAVWVLCESFTGKRVKRGKEEKAGHGWGSSASLFPVGPPSAYHRWI